MRKISDLTQFVKQAASNDIEKASRLLGLSTEKLEDCMKGSKVMDVYRHDNGSYELFTLSKVK